MHAVEAGRLDPRKKIVLVDMDGTLADAAHRLHHIQQTPKDWKAFFAAMGRDPLIPAVAEWVRALPPEYQVVIVTGRPADYAGVTAAWLRQHDLPFVRIYLRRSGDHRPDYVAKQDLLKVIPVSRIAFAIDDREPVCAMWRRNGVRCFLGSSGEANREVNEIYRQKD